MKKLATLIVLALDMLFLTSLLAQSINSELVNIVLPETWHSQCKENIILGTEGTVYNWIDDKTNGHQFGNLVIYKPMIGTTSKSMIEYMVNSMVDTSEWKDLCKYSLKNIDGKEITDYEFVGKYKNFHVKGNAIATFIDEWGIVIMDIQIPKPGFKPYSIWENLKWK